jgi:hypothetical protein
MLMKPTVLALSLFALIACQSGNCRSNRTDKEKESKKSDALVNTGSQNRIKVFKYDGTLQCGMGKSIPLAEAQKELAGLTVYSADNKNDGLMRIQVCGAPTGRANVFEIDLSALDKAKAMGFKEWTFN